jgi:hypothetical protein
VNHSEILETIRKMIKDGDVKTKGAYECLPFDKLGWHKNHSAMVIPLAVVAHLLDLCEYHEFIKNHKDPFDFCLRTKVPRSSRLVLVTFDEDGVETDEPLQNICRYVPVKSGGKLIKIMPPLPHSFQERRMSIDSQYFVKPCNNMVDFNWDIDYDYYFDKAENLVNAILGEDSDNQDEE